MTASTWMRIASLPSSLVLQSGVMKFLTVYARSMRINRLQTLVQLLEEVLSSEAIEDEFTPVRTLHAVTVMLQVAQTVQEEEEDRQSATASRTHLLPDMVCQSQTITTKLRKLCTQVRC